MTKKYRENGRYMKQMHELEINIAVGAEHFSQQLQSRRSNIKTRCKNHLRKPEKC